MRANAASCIGFGFIFFIFPAEVSGFLSTNMKVPEIILFVLGIGLFINGVHLVWASFKPLPSKQLVLYFSGGDYIWVLGSVYLLLSGIWITTSIGILVTILVSGMVGSFGILQMLKRKEMGNY